MNKLNTNYLLFLDSNFNLLNIKHNNHEKTYLETLHNNGFLQLIKKATRIANNSFSLIDHICAKNTNFKITTGTIISNISDHFITFISLSAIPKKNTKTILHRSFNANAKKEFKEAIAQLSWDNVKTCTNPDEAYDEFWNTFKSLYDIYFPLKKINLNRNIHSINDFMTKGLLTSRSTKNKLHKILLKDPTEQNLTKYKTYRNLFNLLVKRAKNLHYATQLNANKHNPKKTWDIFNKITGRGGQSTEDMIEIDINGTTSNDPKLISEHFNDFFSSIGKAISDSIPFVNPTTTPQPELNVNPELIFDRISPSMVCDIINLLPSKNSCDINGISNSLIKFLKNEIASPLAHIFDLSLQMGIFPEELKISRVVPIFKAGNPLFCDNYRPIALVSSIAKILEKIVSIRLTNHLELNNIIYPHQFGFQRGLSTEHNLLHLVNYVSNALNKGEYCIGVFLDLKKAFDVVSHKHLLTKLKKLGINGITLDWFSSYLNNRRQVVDIKGCISTEKSVNISVMQGSTLGPLLFLCFINDIYTATKLFTLLFADDTCLLKSGKNLNELIKYFNDEIKKLTNWLMANKLALNVAKCKYIIFHNKGKIIRPDTPPVQCNYNIIGEYNDPNKIIDLERITQSNAKPENRSYKYLGILIDENLSFNSHVDYICKKLSRGLFCLKRAKPYLKQEAMKTLYFALFHSHLNYCNSILSCTSQSNINRIFIMQKKAIHIITNSKYNEHTANLFVNLGILPLEKLFKFNITRFMHSIKYGYGPKSFSNTWKTNANRPYNHELRNNDDFSVDFPNYERFKKMPLYSFPVTWNALDELKNQTNIGVFCHSLKAELLGQIVNPLIPVMT